MSGLIKPLMEMEEYRHLISNVDRGISPISVHGLSESNKAHIIYSLYEHLNKPVVIVTYNDLEAKKIYEDLSFFTDDALYFPSREVMLYDIEAVSSVIASERLRTIRQILRKDRLILVTSVDNIVQKYVNPEIYKRYMMRLRVGDTVDMSGLVNNFIMSGYGRVDMVEGKGQFSIRGGIVDFFPLIGEEAYRVELFDNEIDSIRTFDVLSQRSIDRADEAEIFPAREIIIDRNSADMGYCRIKAELESCLKIGKNKKNRDSYEHLRGKINNVLERVKETIYFEGIDGYLPFFYDKFYKLFDYLSAAPVVVVDEPSRVLQRVETLTFEFQELYENMLGKGEVLPSQGELLYSKGETSGTLLDNKLVTFSIMPRMVEEFSPRATVNFTVVSMHAFHGQMELLIDDLKLWKSRGYRVVILSGTSSRGQRLVDSLGDKGIEACYYDVLGGDLVPGQIAVTWGILSRGFEYPSIHLAVVSDREIFGEPKQRRRTAPVKGVARIKSFTDLKAGDYVVHVNHGIGIFQGVKQLVVEGIKRDYLDIRYASGDKLYVPVDQLDLVQKYIGGEDKPPKIYKLGGTDWVKVKARVKDSIKEMADDLIKLYALRQEVQGHAFPPDTLWQKQFEEEFPYEETPDQITAIGEIKRDMENSRPMDRLLCGDVGYGKTEVAIRAAFKAAMDGKQVAFLVPTTILAEQHYNNFMQRFADFPIKIDMISRFRSQSEQKKTLKALREGRVDVLVGTHRLLQKDIVFKDLGLLVIDEEQRFGVAHKETIKSLKKNVDVLTLTATPIPRTLHMSLLGVRDMSVIETPPEERYPVQTYVVEFNEQLIRDSILRELNRGGQVYFVYNRVETINDMLIRLNALVPEARAAIGHGQMSEHELENVMVNFLKGEYDILLCTTIIETGLDIPNVNTLIVYDADRMGLSQLYQLRGRVGRSNRLAYAYFTYKKDKILQEVAEKRLKAIKEFTEFGSGFKIAMRDLEIRGAGNMLGPEQHGHMETVGYDMYCRLLEEAVHEIKGEKIMQPVDTSVDLNINAYIDSDYIKDESQKIEVYKKIAAIKDKNDLYEVEEEIEDRFGDIPGSLRSLLSIAYIKTLASKIGISSITQKGDAVNMHFSGTVGANQRWILEVVNRYGKHISFNASKIPYFSVKTLGLKDADILKLLAEIAETINDLQ